MPGEFGRGALQARCPLEGKANNREQGLRLRAEREAKLVVVLRGANLSRIEGWRCADTF